MKDQRQKRNDASMYLLGICSVTYIAFLSEQLVPQSTSRNPEKKEGSVGLGSSPHVPEASAVNESDTHSSRASRASTQTGPKMATFQVPVFPSQWLSEKNADVFRNEPSIMTEV